QHSRTTRVVELLQSVCHECGGLDWRSYDLRWPRADGVTVSLPGRMLLFERPAICRALRETTSRLSDVETAGSRHFGLTAEAEVQRDPASGREFLCVYVAGIEPGSAADEAGLMPGDELVAVNDRLVSQLDMVYIENLFDKSSSLTLLVRSSRHQQQPPTQQQQPLTSMNSKMQARPARLQQSATIDSGELATRRAQQLKRQANVASSSPDTGSHCQSNSSASSATVDPSLVRPSVESRLRMTSLELLETERVYVECLRTLSVRYLEPLCDWLSPPSPPKELRQLTETVAGQLSTPAHAEFLHALKQRWRHRQQRRHQGLAG
uniref:PDZ domain-containing protein n=1 Tax=Macrostomum lignano TaxID=282301 RepID=A0A1I8FTN8_9PLAT